MKVEALRRLAAFLAQRPLAMLGVLAVVSLGIYAVIAELSWQFMPDGESIERPILAAVVLLGTVFACYLAAIFVAIRAGDDRRLLASIVLAGIAFRLAMLYSWPIQEIDIYRYLWDGAATASGVSPYQYSPQQALARSGDERLPSNLQRLVALRDSSPALATVLSRVHYGELPTIYPPVSQAVFALVTLLTPRDTGVLGRIVIMKAALVLFDLATLVVVIGLLRLAGRHVGWSLAYAWCPLVIKEIANTGHLDAVAVFLTTLALCFAVRPLTIRKTAITVRRGMLQGFVSAGLLGLAVGAKLYPIGLAPLFAVVWWRLFGWPKALLLTIGLLVLVALPLWPMVPASSIPQTEEKESVAVVDGDLPPPPENTVTTDAQDPSRGLTTFLRRWEINDFLFMLMVENLKPTGQAGAQQQPWFAVMPETWRGWLLEAPARWLQLDLADTAFLVTRFITAAIFLLVALGLAWQTRLSDDPNLWLRAALLTLAWLWLLSPTQNPWYWTWALPLVMFARSKAWLVISGLALVYYLRFWFSYHWPDAPVPGTSYQGTAFFDFIVTWLEYGPWFVWLAIDGCRWRRMAKRTQQVSTQPSVGPTLQDATQTTRKHLLGHALLKLARRTVP